MVPWSFMNKAGCLSCSTMLKGFGPGAGIEKTANEVLVSPRVLVNSALGLGRASDRVAAERIDARTRRSIRANAKPAAQSWPARAEPALTTCSVIL